MPWLDWNHTPEFDPKIDVPRTTINNFAGPKQPPWRDGLPSSCGALLAHMLLRFSNRNIDESSIYRGISIVGMCGLGPFLHQDHENSPLPSFHMVQPALFMIFRSFSLLETTILWCHRRSASTCCTTAWPGDS